jgi:hypothetical protein
MVSSLPLVHLLHERKIESWTRRMQMESDGEMALNRIGGMRTVAAAAAEGVWDAQRLLPGTASTSLSPHRRCVAIRYPPR